MNQNGIICAGDVCTYAYLDKNKSLSIVEVVNELSEEVVVVKFHQVISDDSGNGFFTYLCNSGGTMNVSRKYLNKIDIIGSQNEEIAELKETIALQAETLETHNKKWKTARNDGIKLFAEVLKEYKCSYDLDNYHSFDAVDIEVIDDLVKEMVGDKDD